MTSARAKWIGPASIVAGICGWGAYAVAFVVGGLSSSWGTGPVALIYLSLILAALSLVLGVTGLIRGPGRVFATVGLLAPTAFALHWVGVFRL